MIQLQHTHGCKKRLLRFTSKCTLSLNVSLLPVGSVQHCMQCCISSHLYLGTADFQHICCTMGTHSSDTMIVSIQAVRAGDVRTFQQEMDSNMHTFCVQVCNLYMAHITLSSSSLSAMTYCIAKTMLALDITDTHGLCCLALPYTLDGLSFNHVQHLSLSAL